MCGIIGYTGSEDVREVLLDALELLEYRGYDSAGIALRDEESGKTEVRKCAGRVSDLRAICASEKVVSQCGIGHTRWATHGGVNDCNAHPHQVGKVTLVHNGIIENYRELIADYDLADTLKSETDSEVVAALLNRFYEGNPEEAIKKTVSKLKGTFALVILFEDQKDVIYSTRNVSPIVATICKEGAMLASDLTALCRFTNRYFVVPEYHILKLSADKLTLTDFDGNEVLPKYLTVDWELNSAGKNGYPFYMEKEIMEQPEAIKNTIKDRIVNGLPDFTADGVPDSLFTDCDRICVVACGTAMHAGLVAQALVKSIVHVQMDVELASEFRYRKMPVNQKALVIVVSQSGETADTLAALRLAKEKGITTMAVVNVVGSSIAREADKVFYTLAGPEISVATTKSYSAQLAAVYCLAVQFAKVREKITEEQYSYYISELLTLPEKMQKVLEDKERIQWFAAKYANAHDVFFVGRGIDYAVCLEGSLKLKEISYIHSEAYAAGELKHGTISLIEQGTLVIGVLTQKELYEKTISNMLECKSRGAYLMGLTTYGNYEIEDQVNFTVYVPKVDEHFVGSLAVIPLQLMGYYVSVAKGLDVDKPRNLAKSVTVE